MLMATVMRPSSIDVSIQNRDDATRRNVDESQPLIFNPSQSGGITAERAERKRKRNRDMAIPFMILLLMDFMIILLLWIVYEAQPASSKDDEDYYRSDLQSDSLHVKLDDGIVVIKNITLTQLLASINGTTTQVETSSNLQRSSNSDFSDGISFDFEHRLFDLLFISAVRGLLLIVVYGLLRLITRLVIILTTIASSVVVLIKAAQFDYRRESDCDCLVYILTFFILALSFAFPWLEFFFLEFNYLPKEISRYATINWYSWQAWLWPRKLPLANGVTFDDSNFDTRQQLLDRQRYITTSMGTSLFVTPTASPPHTPRVRIEPISEEPEPLTVLDLSYVQQGMESLVVIEDLLSSMDGWKLEKTEVGVMCYSRSIGGKKKWRSESIIGCNIHTLWKVLYDQFEQQTKWNPQVSATQLLYKVDDQTDITYVVSSEAGGGLITSRDFVTVRYWQYKDGVYYAVGKAVTHESMPSQSGKIRGENGPSGYKLIPVDDNRTQFVWLCDTDLKGWLPQYLIDQTIVSMAIQMHQRLAGYMDSIIQDHIS